MSYSRQRSFEAVLKAIFAMALDARSTIPEHLRWYSASDMLFSLKLMNMQDNPSRADDCQTLMDIAHYRMQQSKQKSFEQVAA